MIINSYRLLKQLFYNVQQSYENKTSFFAYHAAKILQLKFILKCMLIIIVNKPEIQNQVLKNRLSELKLSNLVSERPHCHLNLQVHDQPELPDNRYYNNLKFSVCQTYLFSYFLIFIFFFTD